MNTASAQMESTAANTNKTTKAATKPAEKSPATTVPSRQMISYDGKPTSEDLIRFGAYFRWEAAGRPAGDGVGFWLDSERDFLEQADQVEPMAS